MANYYGFTRTNYFHVKDEAQFRELMGRLYGSEDTVELWEGKDQSGAAVFAFGCYGGLSGLRDADEDDEAEASYDRFIDALQKCVADDDAVIILEAGHEKLRYLVGQYEVITAGGYRANNVRDLALAEAKELLQDPQWHSKCEY